MQYHRLLLNRALIGTTAGTTSLRSYNGYFVYGNTLGGGIVNSFNVRTFLTDPLNHVIVNDFSAYLSANTTPEEWVNIVGSDQDLSTIFNEFYETTVMQGQQTSAGVINTSLVNTGTIHLHESDHIWNGTSPPTGLDNIPLPINESSRSSAVVDVTSKFSTEQGYYIPVFITRIHEQNSKDSYDECPDRISMWLTPELFPNIETTIDTERNVPDVTLRVRSDQQRSSQSVFNPTSFTSLANDLVSRCYGSQCIDNRYCDLLYFSNRRTIELNAIDTQHIQNLLGDNAIGFTSADVLSVLVKEMSMNGFSVVQDVFNCLID